MEINIFLINDVDINATLKQVLNDIILATLNGIEDWCLPIIVNKIRVGTICYEFLDSLKMTFSTGIEYRRLAISVNLIHIAATLLHEKVDKMHLTLSRCVVQSGLIEVIRLVNAYPHLSEDAGHPDSLIVTLYQSRRKHGGLLVIGLIKKLTHVIPMSLVLLDNLINVALLHKV
jgi:hypothetical protein